MKKEELTLGEKLTLIDEVLTRSVGEFVDPEGVFRKKLEAKARGENVQINIKFGIDPTRPDIHLGHAVVFRALNKLQKIGCKIIFLAGDFTATIGDPTGKNKVRPEIDFEEIQNNVLTYVNQLHKLIDIERGPDGAIVDTGTFGWIRNSDWYISPADIQIDLDGLSKSLGGQEKGRLLAKVGTAGGEIKDLDPNALVVKSALLESAYNMQTRFLHAAQIQFVTLMNLLRNLRRVTYSQLIERDMFQNRLRENEPLFMHEMLYPVLQGIDSMVMAKIYGSCDLEVGGTDQTFNMLVGRDVMSNEGQIPQAVLSFKLIEGIDGKEKMSKSLNNYIAITDEPNEMFGKTMSVPDTSIVNYFELATDVPTDEIEKIKAQLEDKLVNPRDLKVRLAKEIVKLYHSAEAAETAEKYFVDTFSNKVAPTDIAATSVNSEHENIIDVIVRMGFAKSKSDATRKVEQGGVSIDGKKVTEENIRFDRNEHEGKVMKVGKKDFVKIVFSN